MTISGTKNVIEKVSNQKMFYSHLQTSASALLAKAET